MAIFALGKFRRSALKDDCSTLRASLGAEIDNMVSALDNLHIVLHNNHRMASSNQCVKGLEEAIYIVDVQSRSRLVEDKHHSLVGELACEV